MNKKSTSKRYGTDWERLKNMKDEDIDFSDIPKITPEMFKNAVVRKGLKSGRTNSQETLAVDSDIIEFFKAQGQNYQTVINQLLRTYVEEQKTN
ncbi:MAG TPA: BrnA antitoxin family protein [Pyrinomonadaceae bacterium]|nr:BrnA antitoxin family protein [Pyrinomonadaceae bacterium]